MVKPGNKKIKSEKLYLFGKTFTVKRYLGLHPLFLMVIVAILLFFGYKYTTIYLEKRQFTTKQKQIKELGDRVAAEFPPSDRQSEEYCKYSNQKFEKGDRSCYVSETINIANQSVSDANRLKELVEKNQNVKFENGNSSKRNDTIFEENEAYNDEDYIRTYILETTEEKDLRCSSSIGYKSLSKSLSINFDCYLIGKAKAEHFPVR